MGWDLRGDEKMGRLERMKGIHGLGFKGRMERMGGIRIE
jgi:hypothetical protein